MNLKQLALFSFLILSAGQTIAQMDTINLSDYKIKNFKYRALNSFFRFGQNNNISRKNFNGADKQNNISYGGNFSFFYNGIFSSEKWQKNTEVSLRLNYNSNESDLDGNETSTISYFSGLDFENSRRKYYAFNEFVEFNLNLSIDLNKSNFSSLTNGFASENTTKYSDYRGTIALKTGGGRIDQVSDARHAFFILKELKKEKKLSRDLDAAEILDFAQMINQLKNKRFFDSRLRKIYELEAVDSFLQSKNLISDSDIRYFTTLNDMWSFGSGPLRYSGHRFSLVAFTGFENLWDRNSFFSEEFKTKTISAYAGIEYKKEKPINLYNQHSFTGFAYIGYAGGKITEDAFSPEEKLVLPKINIGIVEKLGYYPNTRTSIEYSVFAHYVRVFDFLEDSNDPNDPVELNLRGLNVGADFDFIYYISPKFRVSAQPSIQYRFFKLKDDPELIDDLILSNQLLFLIRDPQCENSNCAFKGTGEKNHTFNFNISLSYSFF